MRATWFVILLLMVAGCTRKPATVSKQPKPGEFATTAEPVRKELAAAKEDLGDATKGVHKLSEVVAKQPATPATAEVAMGLTQVGSKIESAGGHIDNGGAELAATEAEVARMKQSYSTLSSDNEKLVERVKNAENEERSKIKWILIAIGLVGLVGGFGFVTAAIGFGMPGGLKVGIPGAGFGMLCITAGLYLNTIVWATAIACAVGLLALLGYGAWVLFKVHPDEVATPMTLKERLKWVEDRFTDDGKINEGPPVPVWLVACLCGGLLAGSTHAGEPGADRVFEVLCVTKDNGRGVDGKRLGTFEHGTGFYISKRLVMTAAHNVENGKDSVYLLKGGREVACRVLVYDKEVDVAVLEAEEENKEFYEFLVVGDLVGVGFPGGRGPVVMQGPPVRFVVGIGLTQGASGAPITMNGMVIGMLIQTDKEVKNLCYATAADVLVGYMREAEKKLKKK